MTIRPSRGHDLNLARPAGHAGAHAARLPHAVKILLEHSLGALPLQRVYGDAVLRQMLPG